MPITFKCACGRELVAPDEYAGRQVRCGLCGTVQAVPQVSEPAPVRPQVEPPPGMQPPPYRPQGPGMSPQQEGPWMAPPPQMPGTYQPPYRAPYPPYSAQDASAQWPPYYGYQQQQAPPQYYQYTPQPPYQPPYRPLPTTGPEDVGRRGAKASLIFGAIGIGGYVMGCCLMPCWGVLGLLGCSVTAFVAGWMSLSAATAPDVKDDARLGRAIGFIGIVAAIIFIIFTQIPFWQHYMTLQAGN